MKRVKGNDKTWGQELYYKKNFTVSGKTHELVDLLFMEAS